MKFSDDPLALHDLILQDNFDGALDHLRSNPGDATIKDKDGLLPLHNAAHEGAPFEIMRELVRIDPNSINVKDCDGDLPLHIYLGYNDDLSLEVLRLLQNDDAVRTTNKSGELPLHVAVDNEAPLKVIKELVCVHPEATNIKNARGNLPLHRYLHLSHTNQSFEFFELLQNGAAIRTTNNDGMLPLHKACMSNAPYEVFKELIHVYPEASNVKDVHGNLPLHYFVLNSRKGLSLEIFELLLNDDAVRATNKYGHLPLHLACGNECWNKAILEVTKELIRVYPEAVNIKDDGGDLPLHVYLLCCRNQSLDTFELLRNDEAVKTTNNDGNLPLHMAFSNTYINLDVLRGLLEDYPEASRAANEVDELPLHAACKNKGLKLDALRAILNSYPEATSAVCLSGQTPLHFAAKHWTSEQCELLDELLQRNPNVVSIIDEEGRYALHYACDKENFSIGIIERIIEAHSAIKDKDGRLPLHVAASCGVPPKVIKELILVYPEAINIKDTDQFFRGNLPLHNHLECRNPSLEVVQLLLNDAAARTANDKGMLPLHLAIWEDYDEDYSEIFKELIRVYRGAVNVKDVRGNLPLHYFFYNRGFESLEIFGLLQNESAVRTTNSNGQLPLHLACESNTKLVVLKAVMDAYPEATIAVCESGQTPLHAAAQYWDSEQSELLHELLQRNPKAAKIADNRGRYALHLACDNEDFSIGMIERIVEAYPEALNTKDKSGNLPNIQPWFMELMDIEKNFQSKMQEMTFVAAGAVLESNRSKRKAEGQEPAAEARNKRLKKEIDDLKQQLDEKEGILQQQLDEKDAIVLRCHAQVQAMTKSLIVVTLVGLYCLGQKF